MAHLHPRGRFRLFTSSLAIRRHTPIEGIEIGKIISPRYHDSISSRCSTLCREEGNAKFVSPDQANMALERNPSNLKLLKITRVTHPQFREGGGRYTNTPDPLVTHQITRGGKGILQKDPRVYTLSSNIILSSKPYP